jgi:TorA maturation chaperone TorD
LFIGPGKHISPYESVHVGIEGGGLLWGGATVKVKKFIESSGFEYKSDYCGLPDHIAVEFEFMHKLTEKEGKAWKKNDNNMALRYLEYEKKFIDEHLSQWIPQFCDRVIQESRVSFYQQIAKLTKMYIANEQEQVHLTNFI